MCTSFFALTLFFGKNSDRQGAVGHFQRSPSAGREGTGWLRTKGSSPSVLVWRCLDAVPLEWG